jgi:hypothetical protein
MNRFLMLEETVSSCRFLGFQYQVQRMLRRERSLGFTTAFRTRATVDCARVDIFRISEEIHLFHSRAILFYIIQTNQANI